MSLEYKVEEKQEFSLIGIKRNVNSSNSYDEIPKFWDEIMKSPDWENGVIKGWYGLCYEENGNDFSYMIADDYNNQKPIPIGYETITLPKSLYACFPCKGKIPEALQSVNTKIYKEWIPNCKEYKLNGNYTIEAYIKPEYAEIWIPIAKI